MPVRVQHVSFEVKRIGIVLSAPIVVADLLQHLARPAADAEVPAVRSQANVFQRIPGVLPERWVFQKAPVLVFAQKSVGANRFGVTRGLVRLRMQSRNRSRQRDDPCESGSHPPYFSETAEWI